MLGIWKRFIQIYSHSDNQTYHENVQWNTLCQFYRMFSCILFMLLFLSEQQFFRCLWQTLGLKLDCEQEAYIRQKYDFLRNGRLNYKQFCEEIDRNFNPNDLTRDPAVQRVAAPEL